MEDHSEAPMDQIPPSEMPLWLKKKIEIEQKKKRAQDENSSEVTGQKQQVPPTGQQSIMRMNDEINKENQDDAKPEGDSPAKVPVDETKSEAEVEEEEEELLPEVDDPEYLNPNIENEDGVDMSKGARLNFTFNEGLVVSVLPNGDTFQKIITEKPLPKDIVKGNNLTENK